MINLTKNNNIIQYPICHMDKYACFFRKPFWWQFWQFIANIKIKYDIGEIVVYFVSAFGIVDFFENEEWSVFALDVVVDNVIEGQVLY